MAAFGVTLSLTEKTPQQIIAYLEKMQQLQVSSVFSSLQIPGDDPAPCKTPLHRSARYSGGRGWNLWWTSPPVLSAILRWNSSAAGA